MATTNLLFAGFGGQGILFAGKFLAYKGLIENRQVSWLPSYGPEMRGGTANCSVILSDDQVGSPIVNNPDVLIAMNLPSLDKYEDAVVPGGKIFVDSTLVTRPVRRTDVTVCYIPATKIATDHDMPTLANMVLMGKVLADCPELGDGHMAEALQKVVSARKQNLLTVNETALQLGRDYQD